VSLAIFGHFSQSIDDLFDVTCRLQNRVSRHENLQKAKRRADDFPRRRRHEQTHVVDQQLGQVVRKEVFKLVEDSSDGLKYF
jgi:hypothetical protein